jgi:osmoprotectant transport system ATP-binding protein
MSEKNVVLEFKNTCKRFPGMERNAVNNVNLSIRDGEFVTILGTSGSGKTTLMKMVNLLYDITEGDILFHGESIRNLPPVEHRRKIGYVVQQSGLFPHMTVEANIGVVPNILKWDKSKIQNRAAELLELVDLKPELYRNRYPRQLSGGQQQRVGIARALAADPDVMLMDEPFGAIDAITRESMQNEILRLQRATGKTILFVTHDIGEAFKLGDKVIIMDDGQLQQFDTPNNIMLHPANAFVSKLVSADDPMEKMKTVTIDAVMSPVAKAPTPDDMILPNSVSIENSLPYFFENKDRVLFVKDKNEKVVGQIVWDSLKGILA